MRRLLAAGVVAGMLLVAPLASRAEDGNEPCRDGQGVTLVVDFRSLGGDVNVRCAPQPVSNGYEVFRKTNVSYETVSDRDFVCRIAAKPEDADCSDYPPGDYYWSYWWAKPGQDWQYATKGAGAHKPSPGAYEGWSFINSDQSAPPRYPPPPAVTTTTSSPPPPADAAAPPETTRGRSFASPDAKTAPTVLTSATSAAPESPPSSTPTSTSLALGHVDLSRTGKGGGTSVGFVLSGLAVVTLGAAAVAFARGRSR